MKKIEINTFNKAKEYIMENSRELEKLRFRFFFNNEDPVLVVNELKKYQNKDGGFGNAIEPDFRMPDSSPLATSMAIRIMKEIQFKECDSLIDKTINYLEDTFDYSNNRWFSVHNKVNEYPHAPWWEFNISEKMTVIDYSWGNPTAELIGFLYKYRMRLKKIDINSLIEYSIHYFSNKKEYKSEHEVFCFIRLYQDLENHHKDKLKPSIIYSINELLVKNSEEWKNYVPKPLDFVMDKKGEHFDIPSDLIEKELIYIIENFEENCIIEPNWSWGDNFEKDWKVAKKEWTGVLTFENLLKLKEFDRI